MKNFFIVTVLAVILSGCGSDVVDDGVPQISDPANPVVNGVKMFPHQFLKEYCRDKLENKTCLAVRREATKAFSKRGT